MQADQAAAEQARIQLEFARITRAHLGPHGHAGGQAGQSRAPRATGRRSSRSTRWTRSSSAFSIPERQLEDIRRYQNDKQMRIEILPDRNAPPVAEGKLVFVDNTVTAQTGTVLLKTRVPNAKEVIWPGQFVNVRIVLTIEAGSGGACRRPRCSRDRTAASST